MILMPAEIFGLTVKDNTLRSGLRKAMSDKAVFKSVTYQPEGSEKLSSLI